MPSYRIHETKKGFHIVDDETIGKSYDYGTAYKYRTNAEYALRKMQGLPYDPQMKKEVFDDVSPPDWRVSWYNRIGSRQFKHFTDESEADKFMAKEMAKIKKEEMKGSDGAALIQSTRR